VDIVHVDAGLSVKVTALARPVDYAVGWPVDLYVEGFASHVVVCMRLDVNDGNKAGLGEEFRMIDAFNDLPAVVVGSLYTYVEVHSAYTMSLSTSLV